MPLRLLALAVAALLVAGCATPVTPVQQAQVEALVDRVLVQHAIRIGVDSCGDQPARLTVYCSPPLREPFMAYHVMTNLATDDDLSRVWAALSPIECVTVREALRRAAEPPTVQHKRWGLVIVEAPIIADTTEQVRSRVVSLLDWLEARGIPFVIAPPSTGDDSAARDKLRV